MGTAAAGLQRVTVRLERSHAEVGHADVVLLVEKQVLRLQVSMAVTYRSDGYGGVLSFRWLQRIGHSPQDTITRFASPGKRLIID